MEAWTSKIVLKIYFKASSKYLETGDTVVRTRPVGKAQLDNTKLCSDGNGLLFSQKRSAGYSNPDALEDLSKQKTSLQAMHEI